MKSVKCYLKGNKRLRFSGVGVMPNETFKKYLAYVQP